METKDCNIIKNNTPSWVFFVFFKLYKSILNMLPKKVLYI